jgi:protein CpxP
MSILNSTFRKAAISIVVTAGLATTVVAVAQPGSGFGPGMMGRGGPGMMMGGHGPMFASNDGDVGKFQQDRLGQLKSQLSITPEQQPAWDAFAAKAAEQAKTMQALRKDSGATTMPERMKQQQQVMAERQKAMGSMSESFTKLYEVLTQKQREVFERSYGGPMHRHG